MFIIAAINTHDFEFSVVYDLGKGFICPEGKEEETGPC